MEAIRQFYKQFCRETFDGSGRLAQFEIVCPDDFNFAYDVADRLARIDPDRLALEWCNKAGAHRRFTFGDLRELSNKTANVLLAHGIRKGDRVMVLLKRHYEYWYVTLALHKIGAVVLPAAASLSVPDLIHRIRTASVRAVIATPDGKVAEQLERVRDYCPELEQLYLVRSRREGFIPLTDEIDAASSLLTRISTRAGDPLIIYFTSGTTGEPKAVAHDHTYPLAHILTAKYWQRVQADGLHMTVADTGWGKASWGMIYGQWICGAPVFVYDFDRFMPKELLRILIRYPIVTFCAPPTVYRFLVKEDPRLWAQVGILHACATGEALGSETFRRFNELTGLKISEGFGQSENALLAGVLEGDAARPGSMGLPSPAYRVGLMDANGTLIDSPDVIGEIVILPTHGQRQHGMFSGYLGEEELYAHVWRDGVYHTGDTAYRDEDGYLWYTGRNDDVIKSSGYRIGPGEIENCLLGHPAVLECAVTGVPSHSRGLVVKATVVLAQGHEPTERLVAELMQYVKRQTAPYKVPRIVEFVRELPKTASGKIRREVIRQKDKGKYGTVK